MEFATRHENLHQLSCRLYKEAKTRPSKKFRDIHTWLWNEEVLKLAWKSVRKNHGSAGIDRLTINDVEKQGVSKFLDSIKTELQSRSYKPDYIKRVYIPKSNGKLRPLGITTIRDRVVQTAVKLVIEPVFEAGFEDFSYGFRPDRSTKDACMAVRRCIDAGCHNVFDADIASCFDSIPHEKLIKQVGNKLEDTFILSLIRSWLKAGVIENGRIQYPETGTPQGGVISPLLSNIYLDRFDKMWKNNRISIDRRAHLVRYADDFVILSERLTSYEHVKKILDTLDLRLSRKKTRLIHARNGFDFLGFHIRLNEQGEYKKITIAPSRKSIDKVIEKINELTNENNFRVTPDETINRINQVLNSFSGYYSDMDSSNAKRYVQEHCNKRLRKYIQTHMGLSVDQVSDKYLYDGLHLVHIA